MRWLAKNCISKSYSPLELRNTSALVHQGQVSKGPLLCGLRMPAVLSRELERVGVGHAHWLQKGSGKSPWLCTLVGCSDAAGQCPACACERAPVGQPPRLKEQEVPVTVSAHLPQPGRGVLLSLPMFLASTRQ